MHRMITTLLAKGKKACDTSRKTDVMIILATLIGVASLGLRWLDSELSFVFPGGTNCLGAKEVEVCQLG